MSPLGADPVECQLWIGFNPSGVSGNRQLQTPSSRPAQPAPSAVSPIAALTKTRASSVDSRGKPNHREIIIAPEPRITGPAQQKPWPKNIAPCGAHKMLSRAGRAGRQPRIFLA